MDFIEENNEFMNLDEDGDEDIFIATCHECNEQFTLRGEEEAKHCPHCEIKFD